ncbi:response regulator [Ensifer sp. SSB1]|jgi:DNA-binding NtrC family response regulator|uniref:response regulator n=1 Tax=Ensifer sp. SSB1 TaxID=2795385 RepID=UPI000DE42BDF|nr:response regulator [Ensifer sp. SSB1]MBK5569657.1 response regulator [Ensifer sp. SSB1]
MDEVPPHVRAVLILEDNFLIASDAEEILTSLGIAEVTIAGNADQAMEILSRQGFDFAILDVSLGDHTSFDVADAMLARGMPFGFTSGYGDIELFPSHLRGIPRIDKPFNERSLGQLIAAGMRYE